MNFGDKKIIWQSISAHPAQNTNFMNSLIYLGLNFRFTQFGMILF
jgi:hypothetical protein